MRYLLILLIFSIFLVPIQAQDEAQTPYEIALQRIEEARVSGATRLSLSELGLRELPPEIGQLSSLQDLYLDYNELSSLPIEIGNLNQLRTLSLSSNNLRILPSEIGNLDSLRRLSLQENQLS